MRTFKQAKAEINSLGLSLNRTDYGELRVAFRAHDVRDPEASAYYTNDLNDAVGTALHMAGAQRIPERT